MVACSATPGAPLMTTDRRALGEGLRHRIDDFEAADGVGDADDAETAQAGIGVGGEAGALLIAGVDDLQRAAFELLEEREDEIAGHAEDVADALFPEAADQVSADRFVRRRAHLSRRAPNALFAVSRGGNALRHMRFPFPSKSDTLERAKPEFPAEFDRRL